MNKSTFLFLSAMLLLASCKNQEFDVVIRGGTVYDGSGKPGVVTDVGINADTVAFVGAAACAAADQWLN